MADLVVDGITYHRELPEPYTPPPGWRLTGGPFCERCWLDAGIAAGCAGHGEPLPRNDASAEVDVRSGSVRGARPERVNAQTAGLDPILSAQEASPA